MGNLMSEYKRVADLLGVPMKGETREEHEQFYKLLYTTEFEVRACPFCGQSGFGMTGIHFADERLTHLTCDECEADGPWTRPSKTGKEAVDAWNRRKRPYYY